MADRAYYEALSRDQLIARLKVAEDALVLVGWTGLHNPIDSDRADAALQQWMTWSHMVGGSDFTSPANQPDVDALIPVLSATRRRIRAEVLAALRDEEDGGRDG